MRGYLPFFLVFILIFLVAAGLFVMTEKLGEARNIVIEETLEPPLGGQNRNRNRKMNKRELLDALNSGQREFKNVELNNLK